MGPRWQRILVSGGIATGIATVAVPAVIAYGLVRGNSGGPEDEVAQTTSTATVGATATTTLPGTPSPTLSALTPERAPETTPEVAEPPPPTVEPSLPTPIEEAPPAPQEESPSATPTAPPATPTIEPVASSIFRGPGVLFELEGGEIDGLTITVQGTVSSRDFKIARIVWDWGDGTVEESWFPARHTYPQAGRYMWSVTVYDDGGTAIAGQSSSLDIGQ